jgi:hypothetical protein
MDCRQAQHRLFDCEDPCLAACDVEVAQHLRDCSACRELSGQLTGMELTWRSLPELPEAEAAKQAFLARQPATASDACVRQPLSLLPRRSSRRRMLQWCAASAASLLAIGTSAWLVVSDQQARGDDDLLDRLVDWNLRLTQTESSDDRNRLFQRERNQFDTLLAGPSLATGQLALFQAFVENGRWLAAHHDALTEADRFDSLADRLLQCATEAGTAGNLRRMSRLLTQYNRLLESGVGMNVARVEARGVLDIDHQRRLERFALGDPDRILQLAALLETAPGASRREIYRALGIHGKHAKKNSRAKTPRAKAEKKGARSRVD